jgi:hypothetical protein
MRNPRPPRSTAPAPIRERSGGGGRMRCRELGGRPLVLPRVFKCGPIIAGPQALQRFLVTEELSPMQRPAAPGLCVKCRLGQFLLQRS